MSKVVEGFDGMMRLVFGGGRLGGFLITSFVLVLSLTGVCS